MSEKETETYEGKTDINFDEENYLLNEDSLCYDLILNFNSFEQLKHNGWTANFSVEGKKKYDQAIKNNNIVIGVTGIKNRGKSYLIGRIMNNKNYNPSSGFLVTTFGISCNFPQLKGNTFITLDTAGRDNPLLQNAFYEEENILEIARDQKICEIALNDFIIKESNILIAVVEQLSFAEQDMLRTLIERLKQKEVRNFENRRLIVIHNLMNIKEVEGINKFIQDILLKSLTFKLRPASMGKIDDEENPIDDSNKTYYIQDNENEEDKLEIIHFVIGDDSDEKIREEFNEPAFRFIRDIITVDTQRQFDILTSFRDFIVNNAKNNKYITGGEFKNDSLILGKEIKKKFNIANLKEPVEKIIIPIQLKDKNIKFMLNHVMTDSKGVRSFFNKNEPLSSLKIVKINEKYYIKILIEIFGKVNSFGYKIEQDSDQYYIAFNGETSEINLDEILEDKHKNETKNNNFDVGPIGNLEYQKIEFQIRIDKLWDKTINKEKISKIILDKNEKIEPEIDPEKGLYIYLFPINLMDIA